MGSYASGRLAIEFATSTPNHVLSAFSALAVTGLGAPPLPEPVVEVWEYWQPEWREVGWAEGQGDPFPDEPWRHDWASELDGVLRWTGAHWELLCSFLWKTHPVAASEALAWLAPYVEAEHRPWRQLVGHAHHEYDPAPHLFWVKAGRWERQDLNPEGYIAP
jgi:hypothetical protein